MSYLVLARKYRPQSFEDLVGQEHVARTLANAIEGGRVAHAFLFTGVRGVGKTTSARLLAKCLNCLGEDGSAKGPTAKPCQVCAACKEIAAGNDIDVQEIDGASYNGVDEVRRLQEGLAFRPARDRFKIYIVDEVHMLSNAAWNAFLKTLEEPPPHVKFIFATTEVHKVPVTILSRCQRYDFKLISTQLIAKRLEEVLALEKIEADGGAIAVIAREAAGSMRDAMSLLDQVIAFSGQKLTAEDVARVLGVADRRVLHELGSALVTGDAKATLKVVDGLAQQGFDFAHVARDVLQHLRNLVVAKVSGEDGRELLDLADEEVADVMSLAKQTDGDDLMRLYQGFSKAFDEVVRSGQPRAALEMLLVRLARRPALLPLDELLARLGELERRLGGAPPPPRGAASGGGGAGGSRSRGGAVDQGPARADAAPSSSMSMSQAGAAPSVSPQSDAPWAAPPPQSTPVSRPNFPPSQASAPQGVPQASAPPRNFPPSQASAPQADVPWAAPPPQSTPVSRPNFPPSQASAPQANPAWAAPPSQSPASPRPNFPPSQASAPQANPAWAAPPSQSPASPRPNFPPSQASAPQANPAWAAPAPQAPAPPRPNPLPPPPVQANPSFDMPPLPKAVAPSKEGGDNLASWRRVVERVRATRPPLASILEHALPMEIGPERIRIALDELLASQAREADAFSLLTQEARSLFGDVTLLLEEKTPSQTAAMTLASMAIARRREELTAARNAVAEHPLVRHAIALFNADLREVRLPAGAED
ncbi:DNA polymerase III subunit gamma/tau [Pendulispora albinea]|uniref:DNA polymerase III subunit gamma/tau n=1 Tax=Pendulispora albinea TaxID=2741071 RepID=A0ABZ2LLN7_9BACT